jgi:hypothetical protein
MTTQQTSAPVAHRLRTRPATLLTALGVLVAITVSVLILALTGADLALARPVTGSAAGPGSHYTCLGNAQPGLCLPAANSPVQFVPGGFRQLAHGTLPGQQTFTISGERYWFQDRLYFTLSIAINRPGVPDGTGGSFDPSQPRGVLASTVVAACGPARYAVVFGLLRARSDSVLALRDHRTTSLRHVSIPAALHAGGVLVYASLAGPPSELTVRQPNRKLALDEKFPTHNGCSREGPR